MQVTVEKDSLKFNGGFYVTLHRTIRIPDTAKTYNLPPSLGALPLLSVDDYADKVPDKWRKIGGAFTVMHPREAAWINFGGNYAHAVKVGFGKVCAITGKSWSNRLSSTDQNYMVAPRPQYWVDGINFGDGVVRQIVAERLGSGYTIEEQVTDEAEWGGLQLLVMPPKEEFRNKVFADRAKKGIWQWLADMPEYTFGPTWAVTDGATTPSTVNISFESSSGTTLSNSHGYENVTLSYASANNVSEGVTRGIKRRLSSEREQTFAASDVMGIAAGGKISQKIYPDPYGIEYWNQDNTGRCFIHVASPELWKEITGLDAHPTPDKSVWEKAGYPYFNMDDSDEDTVVTSKVLKKIKSVGQIDADNGKHQDSDFTPKKTVIKVPHDGKKVIRDSGW